MVIRTALVLGLIALSAAPRWAQEPRAPQPRTYVIVHGAWGGSWAFRKIESLLRARGHIVYRPSLTGLGERVHLATREVGLGTHITDVVNTLRFEELRDVILVGHSYGGMVISGVADRVPERIGRLVYLDAFLPDDGESVASMSPPPRFFDRMIADGFIVPEWVKADQPPPTDVPQPLKTFTEPIALRNPAGARVPATYVLTRERGAPDDPFSPYAERAKRRGWPVITIEADHNPQWSAPEELANVLDRIGQLHP